MKYIAPANAAGKVWVKHEISDATGLVYILFEDETFTCFKSISERIYTIESAFDKYETKAKLLLDSVKYMR